MPNLDVDEVRRKTKANNHRIASITKQAMEMAADAGKGTRLELQNCLLCFYAPGYSLIASSMFQCQLCKEYYFLTYCPQLPQLHTRGASSSGTLPVFCLNCSKEHRLCSNCGASLDLDENYEKKNV